MNARVRHLGKRSPRLPEVSEEDTTDVDKMLAKAREFYAIPVPGGFEAPAPELYLEGLEYEHIWPQVEIYIDAVLGINGRRGSMSEGSGEPNVAGQETESERQGESSFADSVISKGGKHRHTTLSTDSQVSSDSGASLSSDHSAGQQDGNYSLSEDSSKNATEESEGAGPNSESSVGPEHSHDLGGEEIDDDEEGEEEFVWGENVDAQREAEIEAEILAADEIAAAEEGGEGGEGAEEGEDDGIGDSDEGKRRHRRQVHGQSRSAEHRPDDKDEGLGRDLDDPNLTDYEKAQLRIREKIAAIEREMMADKHFTMKGEITAADRGKDALLQEGDKIDFDVRKRPVLVLTEELNAEIETLIKLRVRDRAFDNPVYVSGDQEAPVAKAEDIPDARSGRTLEEDIATLPDRSSGPTEKIGVRPENSEAVKKLQEECISLYADLEQELRSYTSYFTTRQ